MPTGHEKLLCFVLLRQMETPCQTVRAAYQRLADASARAGGASVATVILDWLERELSSLCGQGSEGKEQGSQLVQAAVALASVLRQ